MTDVTATLSTFGQSTANTLSTAGFFMVLILLLLVFMGIILFFVYKSKFNIDVVYVPFDGAPIMTGLKARDYFTGKGQEFRFKIWSAKRLKIKYREEAISPTLIQTVKTPNGRVKRLLWVTADSEGMLVPATVRPEMIVNISKKIDPVTGHEKTEENKSYVLKAKYTDLDEAWAQQETDKWGKLFNTTGKEQLWTLIIVCVCLILALGGFIWGINKNAQVAAANAESSSQISQASASIAELTCLLTEKCISDDRGTPTQPFNRLIVT
jgi:hypothetical protein